MDRYYKKWFFPLALPSMILFVVVILVPFLLGALYSFTRSEERRVGKEC